MGGDLINKYFLCCSRNLFLFLCLWFLRRTPWKISRKSHVSLKISDKLTFFFCSGFHGFRSESTFVLRFIYIMHVYYTPMCNCTNQIIPLLLQFPAAHVGQRSRTDILLKMTYMGGFHLLSVFRKQFFSFDSTHPGFIPASFQLHISFICISSSHHLSFIFHLKRGLFDICGHFLPYWSATEITLRRISR